MGSGSPFYAVPGFVKKTDLPQGDFRKCPLYVAQQK